ncbi:MAG TPA: SGNH/GDSL hydrolase family protein [Streptosporangiaceae bacterium]|jgi:lysophospholipase L1-like esterase
MQPLRTLLAALATLGALAACSAPAKPKPPASYYLSLGDSLSQGVQPNAAGTSAQTSEGYSDQLYATLHRSRPSLRLVRLGCPGETTATMLHGGVCRYKAGSQLAAADAFLRAHRGHVLLVTLDIGANDPQDCANGAGLAMISSCITAMPDAVTNLNTILAGLRAAAGPAAAGPAAAGPDTRIVGMSYYLPELAQWRNGFVGEEVARLSARIAAQYNDMLLNAYAKADVPVADVFGAFDTTNFGDQQTVPGIGTLPRNVALLCRWTWECAPPPRGPNQHANRAGYAVIANAFLRVARL